MDLVIQTNGEPYNFFTCINYEKIFHTKIDKKEEKISKKNFSNRISGIAINLKIIQQSSETDFDHKNLMCVISVYVFTEQYQRIKAVSKQRTAEQDPSRSDILIPVQHDVSTEVVPTACTNQTRPQTTVTVNAVGNLQG